MAKSSSIVGVGSARRSNGRSYESVVRNVPKGGQAPGTSFPSLAGSPDPARAMAAQRSPRKGLSGPTKGLSRNR